MDQDAIIKRAKFIQSSVEIQTQFKFAAPAEIVKAMKIYCNAFYGSSLWDLSGARAGQVFTAWNTSVKLAWGCPQQTRTYFLQQILCCGHTSARTDLISRFVKFFQSLLASASYEVRLLSRFLARDVKSTIGGNLLFVRELS